MRLFEIAVACAAFTGREAVPIVREDALIVWDEGKHEEHFIRSAVFDTKEKSVGFLVPTPSQPTFAEASDTWMAALQKMTAPVIEHRASYVPIGCTMLPFMFMARSMKAGTTSHESGLRVLEETRVAGMDVAVLDATDTSALSKWLAAHDFEMRDALQRWLAPYVAKKWFISAFRYARPDVASATGFVPAIAARAVRITFKTDAPVYPYREPDDAPPVLGRELHLFVLSTSRVAGAESDLANAPWPAAASFAAKMAPPVEVAASLAGVALPAEVWVNELVDRADKRPATDLVFDKIAAADEVRPPPTIIEDGPRIYIPYELPFVAIFVAWLWRRRRRRVSRSP